MFEAPELLPPRRAAATTFTWREHSRLRNACRAASASLIGSATRSSATWLDLHLRARILLRRAEQPYTHNNTQRIRALGFCTRTHTHVPHPSCCVIVLLPRPYRLATGVKQRRWWIPFKTLAGAAMAPTSTTHEGRRAWKNSTAVADPFARAGHRIHTAPTLPPPPPQTTLPAGDDVPFIWNGGGRRRTVDLNLVVMTAPTCMHARLPHCPLRLLPRPSTSPHRRHLTDNQQGSLHYTTTTPPHGFVIPEGTRFAHISDNGKHTVRTAWLLLVCCRA